MRPYLLIAALLLGLSLAAQAPFSGRVVAVKDGDTVEVLRDDSTLARVRLTHVDCPEKGPPFGKAARQLTSDLCFGRTVGVVPRARPDRYGRTLAEVSVDGRSVNMRLVEAGLAWHYTQYSTDTAYSAAEARARIMGLGLWADPAPVAPWEWRKHKHK